MKKLILFTLTLLLISTAAVSADDIWEPELPVLNVITIPDLFSWGDSMNDVKDFLSDYRLYGAEIEEGEDEDFGPFLSYSGENPYERFTYTFFFTKDSSELWQIQTSTVYIDGDDPKGVLETVCDHYGMDFMRRYEDEQMTGHAESTFDGYMITADAETIYYGGYDRANYSQFGGRVFFTFIDRPYYEELLAELG